MTQESLTKTCAFQVLEVEHLTPHAFRLRTERRGLQFIAGQCANIGLPGAGVNREYSLYSGENDPYLDFLIREVTGGLVSVQLQKMRAGDNVEIHGAYGQFCLQKPNDVSRKYLFIATGTGVAPFHSFVRTYPALDYQVLHGVRETAECYGRPTFAPSRYIPCISQAIGPHFMGRVTDYLRNVQVRSDTICYFCGNRRMIEEAYDLLRSKGVPGDNLFTEVFF